MATVETVKAKLQGLINRSNGVTGENHGNLSDAMNALTAGYGQGGAGGGTLAIRAGTVTLSKSWTPLNVEHGCGKLPYIVWLYPIGEFSPNVGVQSGALWFYDYCSATNGSSMVTTFNTLNHQYRPKMDTPDPYAFIVDETAMKCTPSAQWLPATYQWIAIYEV